MWLYSPKHLRKDGHAAVLQLACKYSVISKEQRFLAATEKSPEPHDSCGMLQKFHSPSPLVSTPSFRRSSGFLAATEKSPEH